LAVLVGYVSDERYAALPDVLLEFLDARGSSWETHSRASGSVHLDLTPGEYQVVLQKAGFGAKISRVQLPPSIPYHFRLLSDGLLGYAWPNGSAVAKMPSFGSIPSNRINWNSGAMVASPNASANWAGTMNMVPAPPCR
jgi:hypothetical protein